MNAHKATAFCVDIADAQCFANTTWANTTRQDIRASLWKQGADVVYSRTDGSIVQSTVVGIPTAEPFDIDGLRGLHDVFYSVANLTTNITQPDTTKILYHALQQATAWISGDIGERGSQGDDVGYWSTLAMGSLLIVPLMDFPDSHTFENVATGSSATSANRLIIPYTSVIGYLVVFVTIVAWAGYNIWWINGKIIPNASFFPEIDFASKCVIAENAGPSIGDGSIGNVLCRLSNATSEDIWEELEGITIQGREKENRIILTGGSGDNGLLSLRNRYYY
jgi:hypothetical protein